MIDKFIEEESNKKGFVETIEVEKLRDFLKGKMVIQNPTINWSDPQEPNETCRYNHVYFICPTLGRINIEWKGWKEYCDYACVHFNDDQDVVFDISEPSLEESKREFEKQYFSIIQKMCGVDHG